jgi:hypothetical protein
MICERKQRELGGGDVPAWHHLWGVGFLISQVLSEVWRVFLMLGIPEVESGGGELCEADFRNLAKSLTK